MQSTGVPTVPELQKVLAGEVLSLILPGSRYLWVVPTARDDRRPLNKLATILLKNNQLSSVIYGTAAITSSAHDSLTEEQISRTYAEMGIKRR